MIHKYKLLGKNIVLDVYSGAVHVVDDVLYDVLDYTLEPFMAESSCPEYIKEGLKDKYPLEDIEDSYSDICELYRMGQLFSEDSYAEIAKNWNKKSVVKALCLHVAHDCNLRCKYCFGDTGGFQGERCLMSAEVGKKAIDFVIKNSAERKNIEIDYFGGEPLMNFDVVKEITDYAKKEGEKHGKNFRFTITTNGILLNDEIKEYINENMSNVVLSIDGRKETNDRVRYRVDGSGSYDTIVPKFKDLAESRDQDRYYVRGTFTAYNTEFAQDVIHLADLGFKQTSVEPVVAPETEDYALTAEHIPTVFAEYEKLAEEYVKRYKEGNWFNFFHFMIDLDQGPCVVKRLSGSGQGMSIWQLLRTEIFILVISLSEIRILSWAMLMKALLRKRLRTILRNRIFIPKKNARTVLLNSTVAADAVPMHGILTVILINLMSWRASLKRRE